MTKLSAEAEGLIADFLREAHAYDHSFLRLGRLRWEIEQALGAGQCAFALLVARGASRSAVSNARYGAAAWRSVVAGEITEAEFETLTFDDCRLLCGVPGQRLPGPQLVRLRRAKGLSHELAEALGKTTTSPAALPDLADEALACGYGAAGAEHELLRAVEYRDSTGAATLPTRDALARVRGCHTGDRGNFAALAGQLQRTLRDLPLDRMPPEGLASVLRLLAPLRQQIARTDAEICKRLEQKTGAA